MLHLLASLCNSPQKKQIMAPFGQSLVICLVAAICSISLPFTESSNPNWGSECPQECQCHLTALGHVTMSQWVLPEGSGKGTTSSRPLKVVMCVLGRDTLLTKLFRRIPSDTQVLTMLQTQECPPVVLMEHHMQHLQQLLAFEVRAHVPMTSHFALGSEALKPLRKLKYLSLKGVDLTVESFGISKLHGLRYLSLHDNHLDALPRDSLYGLLSLEELVIANNDLTEIPPLAFIDLPALRRIHLNHNRIQSLDANSFVNLDELKLLDISFNNISDISMISFPPLPKLIWLHLQDNPIRVIFLNAFHHLNGTRMLTLGHKDHPMHIMKYSFVGLSALDSLTIPNLDNNIVEKDMFQGLTSLKSLTLMGNVKMIASEAFAGAYSMENLKMSNCRLRTLSSDSFVGLKNLQSLDLSHNSIMKLPTGLFDPFKSLNELQLQNNNLRHLPYQMLIHLRLHMLRVEGNPWHCSCAMAKWNRSPMARIKTTSYKKCLTNHTTSFQVNRANGFESTDFNNDMTEYYGNALPHTCQRLRVRYVRDPSLRPTCYNPPELRGKRVFEAVRKHLNCYE